MEINAVDLHSRLLSLMKKFHNLCLEQNIQYYIIGGTCLGARRHQGFIPWDDDVDIGVPREDYDRLCAIDVSELPNSLDFLNYRNSEKSPFHYLKVIDNTTTLIERNYRDYIEGLYIDVFPLDGFLENSIFQKLIWKKVWFLQGTIINHCSTSRKDSFIRRIFKYWAEKQNLLLLHTRLERLLRKYKFQESDYVANFLGAYGIKEIVPKKFFGNPTLYTFEDAMFFGPERIDDYLHRIYGNFLELPPKERRIFKHDYLYLNFDLPYKIAKSSGNIFN